MNKSQSLQNLGEFVRQLSRDGVTDGKTFSVWARENEEAMEVVFDYKRLDGMPSIRSLVRPFFHPTLPLVGLNYTQSAHNTLYEFASGWTEPLRLCRGIIFDCNGNLVALPFPKFFNYGEHAETRELPNEPFEATTKHDGHLGIIFEYKGKIYVTTRGDFESRTSVLATHMLREYARKYVWEDKFPEDVTLLVEVIHPETKVYLDYDGKRGFVLIGAFNRATLEDYDNEKLHNFSQLLGIPLVERWMSQELEDLVGLMQDRSVDDQEGFVVRFRSGLRMKLKFMSYIAKMVEDKLGFSYLMQRMIKGNLERMLDTLPEEIYGVALKMLGEIMMAVATPGSQKIKWQALYNLQPEEKRTSYYRGVCRKFLSSL